MLVTQNIDNLHCELLDRATTFGNFSKAGEGTNKYAFTEDVYEIHGNVLYMHCSDPNLACSKYPLFYKCPKLSEENLIPKCTECGSNMKPHCMFFDEAYSE
jgi:NAD-dependent SIR2 family protein deacetylase